MVHDFEMRDPPSWMVDRVAQPKSSQMDFEKMIAFTKEK